MTTPLPRAHPPHFPPYDRTALTPLCWGLLLHMTGLVEESEQCFRTLRGIASGRESGTDLLLRIADSVSSYRDAGSPEKRSEAHRSVVWALGRVLDPDGHRINPPAKGKARKMESGRPRLSTECIRRGDLRKAYDGPENGYSRDPFKKIDPDHMPEIGFAAIAYLMRAHSFFFFRPRQERSFNAAKVSLNDLFQVTQLSFRLYYSLDESHHNQIGAQATYVDRVRQGPNLSAAPWASPFFIWTILHLVEIQRGNIYRQLQYSKEADRYYRHAQERFLRLKVDPFAVSQELQLLPKEQNTPDGRWFITPTLIRTLAERSKVLFNRGLFVDAMMCQIHSLALLAWRGWNRTSKLRQPATFPRIARGLAFLNVLRNESVWNKNEIHNLFYGPKEQVAPFRDMLRRRFLSYLKKLDRPDCSLAADSYARIALTLFILQTRKQSAALPTFPDERLEESTLSTVGNDRREDLVAMASLYEQLGVSVPSAIVRDALMILDAPKKNLTSSEGLESLDRSLARSLGDNIRAHTQPATQPRDKKQFFEAVLEIATQHILNIVTIPRLVQSFLIRPGYKERRKTGDLSGWTVAESIGQAPNWEDQDLSDPSVLKKKEGKLTDKLVVLRRWQSFNPKIPRPHSHAIRGGGYFLMWGGKGIAIDPGYDFLQNLYDEGFSIADIDALVVTHSHPDHEDDLSTLSTLVREWNEYHQHMGSKEPPLSLDLLLNESAHLKFSNWLKASDFGIGRIVPLPLVVWNLDSKTPREELRGGKENVILPLKKKYNFDLEVVPAWHDDVIGKTAAVGLKFHLYRPSNGREKRRCVGILGYTSDTGAYPWTEESGEERKLTGHNVPTDEHRHDTLRVEDQYKNCDVLVAHLGDVRLRELFSLIDPPAADPRLGLSIGKFLSSTFSREGADHIDRQMASKENIGEFFKLLITLHLAPHKSLQAVLDPSSSPQITVARALQEFSRKGKFGQSELRGFSNYREAKKTLTNLTSMHDRAQISDFAQKHLSEAVPATVRWNTPLEDWQVAYALLGFICACSASRWHYGYHLGITGLYRMQRALLKDYQDREANGQRGRERVLVVGELPEELASYRHHVARLLNFTHGNFGPKAPGKSNRRVHAFTGDIGLHIGLGTDEDTNTAEPEDSEKASDQDIASLTLVPKIRCTYCNYNNETVLTPGNYHPPEHILETPLKRLDSAMIYLCTKHDHHPEAEWCPPDFLSRPLLRVI